MSLDTIIITNTAAEKSKRYLSSSQLKKVLREETGYICRQASPNHDGLYADNKFIMRGDFFGQSLDIIFAVEDDHIVVITQMSQHSDSLRGRFYEFIGSSVTAAIEYAN
ncbi:hypothetical protein [Haloquadratum walsbyi]|jgi:hypothetical protein|uniref:Uncharacterized protein n=1 Tax=Haloquadratum walsbyi J07HQW2 TaxID=1238425 RepID=U1PWF9_9EURY|nr:hypothetical protein [Haloquadratum walsbyi]ERG96771.1 MAG: hypothetical protein J07HQW2_03255 [Haloquadratum walsbyi J07HQW2]ERG97140.1 MAG: hypothetical protein J07HQW2_03626 [Haloquadratum walsbyi J07HQW2]